jgi:hypothetical protein
MKRTAFHLALALGATLAIAQAPAPADPAAPAAPPAPPAPTVAANKCEPKPVYPGMKQIQDESKRENFMKSIKAYQDCIKAYVAERKALVEANNAAIRTAVEEHNSVMGKIREAQEAAKKELEGDKK